MFWLPSGARACVAGMDSAQSGAARASLDLALMIAARCLVGVSVYEYFTLLKYKFICSALGHAIL